MIPILFPNNATEFNTQGVGALADAVSCEVIEERNGSYELVLKYKKDGIHFLEISDRSIIYAIPSPYRDPQPFRVYKISRPLNGVVTINANHISYDLSGVPVKPFSAAGAAESLLLLKQNSMTDHIFSFYTDIGGIDKVEYMIPYTTRQILGGIEGSILATFGGEYEFDKFQVKLLSHRGTNNGVTIRYGKNLTGLSMASDSSKSITGVCPYWKQMDENTVYGGIVSFDDEQEYSKVIPLDMSDKFDTKPSIEQLETAAKSYLISNYTSDASFDCEVNFALIDQSEEYKQYKALEKCDLCDTVTVQHESLGVAVTAKIVKIKTDVLKEKYKSVTIGSVRANIAQTIADQKNEIAKIPNLTDMERVSTALTRSILGAKGGYVRLLDTNGDGYPDELYIADNENPELAQKVWRWNYQGWAASKTGYSGPFTLGATLDDGIIADFITVGNLSAELIKTGVLQSSNASFRFNMETGDIFIGGYATESDVDSLSSDLIKQEGDLQSIVESITHIRLEDEGIKIQIQKIVEDGVTKLNTGMGITIDGSCANIHRDGEEMSNSLDEKGMYIIRSKGTENETAILEASANGVNATDLTARNYLIIGHARFEAYETGVGCFYV